MSAAVFQTACKPGALHTALVQDLARRLNVSCPAEPDHKAARQDIPSSNVQHKLASVRAKSAQAANLEVVFDSSVPQSANNMDAWLQHAHLSATEASTTVMALAHSAGSWASFCTAHDVTWDALSCKSARITAKATKAKHQARRVQLQAIFADSGVSKAVAADPLLLSYRSETLVSHMQHLQKLLGKAEASQVVAKLPALLHYKPSTLADKLDALYDLLPEADVGKMVARSPFLLGLSLETLTARIKALQMACPTADVERMVEYCPSLLECKTGKVVGNLKELEALLPKTIGTTAVIQYMPSLLLSDIEKVEQKYTRMQILCMHKPRWRTDLAVIHRKPATFARLLGVSNKVLDRLSFLIEQQGETPDLAANTIMLMTHAKFMTRFPEFEVWQRHRHAAQHINAWQSGVGAGSALAALSSIDQSAATSSPFDLEPSHHDVVVKRYFGADMTRNMTCVRCRQVASACSFMLVRCITCDGGPQLNDIRALAFKVVMDKEPEVCWVCLGPSEPTRPLTQACQCPRSVHRSCLARWQLHSAGKSEETACRFCFAELPDWRSAYSLPTATPVMSVWHNDVHHLLEVKPGVEGQAEFQHNIRRIFALGPHDIIDLTFGCKEPGSDQDMALRGWQSYDAAVHCAAISAGARDAGSLHGSQRSHNQAQDNPTLRNQAPHNQEQHMHRQGQRSPLQSDAAMCQPCDSSSSSSASTAWPVSPLVQRSFSNQSTGASVQHECISRESLTLQGSQKSHRGRSGASLVPAVLRSLHAGSKRSRRDMVRQR